MTIEEKLREGKMIGKIIAFIKGRFPRSIKWEEVRKEILDEYDKAKVKFEVTPYYYRATSGRRTWYWNKDTGEFDGTSFTPS